MPEFFKKLNWERTAIAVFKLGSGSIELGFGALLLILSAAGLDHLVDTILAKELLEDPTDLLALFIQHRLPTFIHDKTWFAVFLAGIGTVKIIGGIGFLFKRNWGYWLLLALLLGLLPFDLYRLAAKPALGFGILAVSQLTILWFLVVFRTRLLKH